MAVVVPTAAVAAVGAVATASACPLIRLKMHCLPMAFTVAAVAGTLAFAPAAIASPTCIRINATTTQCETRGHSQITTSPPAMNNTQWWPFGGYAIGFPW